MVIVLPGQYMWHRLEKTKVPKILTFHNLLWYTYSRCVVNVFHIVWWCMNCFSFLCCDPIQQKDSSYTLHALVTRDLYLYFKCKVCWILYRLNTWGHCWLCCYQSLLFLLMLNRMCKSSSGWQWGIVQMLISAANCLDWGVVRFI